MPLMMIIRRPGPASTLGELMSEAAKLNPRAMQAMKVRKVMKKSTAKKAMNAMQAMKARKVMKKSTVKQATKVMKK